MSQDKHVNEGISWQANMTNRMLRLTVKTPMNRTSDLTQLRSITRRLDHFLAPANDTHADEILVNGVPARFYGNNSDTVLLYLHGGGFCLHLPNTYHNLISQLCQELGCDGLLPDYRLAPEHPFPAGVTDCFTAYRWLLDQGYPGEKILIAGDSAGGCLTLTTLLQIRDAGLSLPAAAVLLSPATDIRPEQEASLTEEDDKADPLLGIEFMRVVLAAYLPEDVDPAQPLASPITADFTGLPPMSFHVGTTELLLDHSTEAVERIKACGGEATLHLWKDMPHVHSLFGWLPESQQAMAMITEFFRQHLSDAEA